MRPFLPYRKATFLIPSGPPHDPDRKHLFVILTDPQEDSDVLLVSLSSLRPALPHDPTCILVAGDHPFVRHDSFVFYRLARIVPVAALRRRVRDGTFIPREPMREEVFSRICQGLLASPHTTPKIKRFYRATSRL
jgi:hypothetical protein